MYAYIIGVITKKTSDSIIVETNNIGYYIRVANLDDYQIGAEHKIVTYHYVKEDVNILFGFNSFEEKELFGLLLSVNGIGPKGAFNIVSKEAVNKTCQAIQEGNTQYLKNFPGIGAKAAGQIVLNLQTKVNFNNSKSTNPKFDDAYEVLISLGYNKKDIIDVLKNIDFSLNEEELIKMALQKIK